MQPSTYQAEIIKAVQQRLKAKKKKGLIVEALAGCGKSTILWMVAQELLREQRKSICHRMTDDSGLFCVGRVGEISRCSFGLDATTQNFL